MQRKSELIFHMTQVVGRSSPTDTFSICLSCQEFAWGKKKRRCVFLRCDGDEWGILMMLQNLLSFCSIMTCFWAKQVADMMWDGGGGGGGLQNDLKRPLASNQSSAYKDTLFNYKGNTSCLSCWMKACSNSSSPVSPTRMLWSDAVRWKTLIKQLLDVALSLLIISWSHKLGNSLSQSVSAPLKADPSDTAAGPDRYQT